MNFGWKIFVKSRTDRARQSVRDGAVEGFISESGDLTNTVAADA